MNQSAGRGRLAESASEIWKRFCDDKELLARLKVTPEEIKFLGNVSLLGQLTSVSAVVMVLENLRIAKRKQSR